MNPTILGVIGPGFLNQVPTVVHPQSRFSIWEFPKIRGYLILGSL